MGYIAKNKAGNVVAICAEAIEIFAKEPTSRAGKQVAAAIQTRRPTTTSYLVGAQRCGGDPASLRRHKFRV